MLKKIAHEPSGGQIVKSQKMSIFYNAFMLDKLKQWDWSQYVKMYSDTYSLQILSLNSSYTIIER